MEVLTRHWFGFHINPTWKSKILEAQNEVFQRMEGLLDPIECSNDFEHYLQQVAIEVEIKLDPEEREHVFHVFDNVDKHGLVTYAISLRDRCYLLDDSRGFPKRAPDFGEITADEIQKFVMLFEAFGVEPLDVYTSRFTTEVSFPVHWYYTQSLEWNRPR